MKKHLLFATCILLTLFSFSQKTITGRITDGATKQPMVGATVVVKGTTTGTATDADGKFSLVVADDAKTLTISYVGFDKKDVSIGANTSFILSLEPTYVPANEVVVTSSRISESIKEAPVQVEKMTARDIKAAASGDFYQSIGNFKGVDIVTSSAGFKVINLRGFSDTRSLRTKQYVDGVDNEAPGLNFPIGNMVGANDLDLEAVEIVSGAASALYGANAMQGIINMTSKSPYDHQGFAVQIKGGGTTVPGPFMDFQFRYAQALDKKQRFALKLTGEYMQMNDWVADDDSLNRYGKLDVEVGLASILRENQYKEVGPDFSQEDKDNAVKLNNWLDFNPWANEFEGPSGKSGTINVHAPGYMEKDLADYNAKSLKASVGLFYKFKNDVQLEGTYKFGYGTAVYQATARYQIKNFKFHQPKIELKGKSFSVRGYAAIEDAGDSYNIGLTGAYISRASISENYVPGYAEKYFDVMDTLTEGFCADCVSESEAPIYVANANAQAQAYATTQWMQPGGQQFEDSFKRIIADPNSLTGTKFFDKSTLVHVEAQYNWNFVKWLDLITGASYRVYLPNSRGTIFEDTSGRRLRVHEFGAYVQATKKVWKDQLKFIASMRVDKNSNFAAQVSPRASMVLSVKNDRVQNVVRVSGTMAFRTPTLQDQYLYLDIGRIKLIGNLNGYNNMYTLESVTRANEIMADSANGGSQATYAASVLEPIVLNKLKPEQVISVDLGYRFELNRKFYIDLSGYYSIYKNFIGFIRVVDPNLDGSTNGVAGEESGETNVLTKNYTAYQTWVNAKKDVPSWGVATSISYYVGKGITPYINYTYSDLDDSNLKKQDGTAVLSGFNTPKHKFNVGISGNRVWKGLGFNANFKWVTSYEWQSPFADGTVPSFHLLDLQLSYEIDKAYSTLRVGASNVYNNMHIEAVGAPKIGALYYVSWTFDMAFKKKSDVVVAAPTQP